MMPATPAHKTTPIVYSLNRPKNTADAIEAALLALTGTRTTCRRPRVC